MQEQSALTKLEKDPQDALFLASRTGDAEYVSFLVDAEGVDVNARDFDASALYHAAHCGQARVVAYLLSRGAVASTAAFEGERVAYAACAPIRVILKRHESRPIMASLTGYPRDMLSLF